MESSLRRFGARVIGIVTAANRNDPAAWEALAECDFAEFRADTFAAGGGLPAAVDIAAAFDDFRAGCARRGLSPEMLLTVRLKRDGGAWPDAEAAHRLAVWEALGCMGPAAGPDWIDIEIERFPEMPADFRGGLRAAGVKLLLSHHDFSGCPESPGLRALLGEMRAAHPDGIKFAVTCLDRAELARLMAFAREAAAASSRACVLSMGETGRALRVLGPALGCPLAYGFLSGRAVAPGQLSAAELARLLDDFAAGLPRALLAPGSESRLLDWAEARLPGTGLA